MAAPRVLGFLAVGIVTVVHATVVAELDPVPPVGSLHDLLRWMQLLPPFYR